MPTLRDNVEAVKRLINKNLDIIRRGAADEMARSGSEYFRLKRSQPEKSKAAHQRAEEACYVMEWVEAIAEVAEEEFPSPNPGNVEVAAEVIHVNAGNISAQEQAAA